MNNIEKVETTGIFKRYIAKTIPLAFDESLSYYEVLCGLLDYLKNTVLPAINNNADAVIELQELYTELKEYVDNYFENLDVQEEINNKLDEMAESGQLADIIAQYLQVASVLGFDTKATLKNAENLVEGSITRTLGTNTYNDGKGNYYKIRTLTSGDVIDDDNILALANYPTYIAEKIPDYRINQIEDNLDTINNETIPELEQEIANTQNNITNDPKFTYVDNPYYQALKFGSNYNGLPFETFENGSNTLNCQGVAMNRRTGKFVFNNGSEIYTVDDTISATKTTLWSGDYGHGGDCCILNNKMYISDSDTNKIHVVNLATGSKVSYTLDNNEIINENHTSYTPKIGGICMDEDENYCYIAIVDDENSNHTIQSGSTVRLYKYDFNTTYEKIGEYEQDICYLQGFTKDKEYFYYVGNKPFTSNYTGNKLHIIKIYDMNTYDILENNSDYEHEGLDYGSRDGVEGLVTICGKYGTFMRIGLLAYYGNCTQVKTFYQNGNNIGSSVKSRSGMCTTELYVEGTFASDSTTTITNFFNDNYPIKLGDRTPNYVEFLSTTFYGSGRNVFGQACWNFYDNSLIIRLGSTSPSSNFIRATWVYVSS